MGDGGFTLAEAGRRVGRSRSAARRWATAGVVTPAGVVRLRADRTGGRWRTTAAWVDEFVRAVTEASRVGHTHHNGGTS